jgi:hypothetical protein
MSKEIRRRIIRLEQADDQRAIRYDVSDRPIGDDEALEDGLHGMPSLSRELTEEEWLELFGRGKA